MERFDVLDKQSKYLSGVSNYYRDPLVMVRGDGKYLYDTENRQYLDFFGGILTVSVGHCHPKVNARIHEQVDTLQHVSTLYPTIPVVELAEKLAAITPGSLQKSFFTNSGTEADETAVLLAQVYTGRSEVIALRHAYHGRSQLAMSLTAHASWRNGPTPIPGIKHAHNAYCYRCPFGLTYPSCDLRCAKDMEELIQTTTSGEIAAVIAEPIQGVGGFITPPPGYFQEVQRIAKQYGGLFISDEVQTGWGRTGKYMFGIQHWGVEPDIMTSAKGMANGASIGWTISTPEVADAFTGMTISTFGGNPVSMSAALGTIEVIEEEHLVANADSVGALLMEGLTDLQTSYPMMGDVRGKGLMIGVEFVHENKRPAPDLTTAFMEATKKRGLLLGKGGLYGNVIRVVPSLNIQPSDVEDALTTMKQALEEISGGVSGAHRSAEGNQRTRV